MFGSRVAVEARGWDVGFKGSHISGGGGRGVPKNTELSKVRLLRTYVNNYIFQIW